MFSFKPKQSTSLDISLTSVRQLDVTKLSNKRYRIDSFKRKEFDSQPQLEKAVKDLFSEAAKKPLYAGTSVWSSTMIARRITLPLLDEKELKGAIDLEADKYIPFSLDDCLLDYYVIQEDKAKQNMEVMLIAAKRNLIAERSRFLESCGFNLNFIDIHPLALTNLFLEFHPEYSAEPTAVIHLGDVPGRLKGEDNFISILRGGSPVVVRDLGDKLSENEVSPETWIQVSGQIMNAAVFYENTFHEPVKNFLISGDEAVCQKVVEAMKRDYQKDLNRWSVLGELEFENPEVKKAIEEYEPNIMVGLGLAVRRLSK